MSSRPLRSPTILAVALLLEFCAIVALHILASAYLVLSVFRAFKGRYGHGRKGVPVLFVHGYAHNPIAPLISRRIGISASAFYRERNKARRRLKKLRPIWVRFGKALQTGRFSA